MRQKICHIILSGTYDEGWSYQENILPKYHVILGYEVFQIVTPYRFDGGKMIKGKERRYVNDHGIKVTVLSCTGERRLRGYFKTFPTLYKTMEDIKPEILFVHNCQFVDTKIIALYLKKHPDTICYVDNHADFSNSATNWISKNILHKIIWKHYVRLLEPYIKYFYGVLPARVDFLADIYGIPREKCKLLVMGADDELVRRSDVKTCREEINRTYGISDKDFLVVTGGKIDLAKTQTIHLMEAVRRIDNDRIKLILFGTVVNELKDKVDELTDGEKIKYIGWIDAKDSYKYFSAADLVIFPGRHSVFWEQAVAQGKPLVVKDWEGTHHVDIGGNVIFLKHDSIEEIEGVLQELISPGSKRYDELKKSAESEKRKEFLYSTIAKRSIGMDVDEE